MANNFIPWLGSDATTSPQQANYGKIAKTGFEAGGFVKAEDFNAALRMTTLVCAGIASVFGFDSLTIDDSEDTINNKIKNPVFESLAVSGRVNITGTLYAEGISSKKGTVSSKVVSTETLTITKNGSIDASDGGSITAQSITANQIKSPATIEALNLKATTTIEAPDGTITTLHSTDIDTSTIKTDTINSNSTGKVTIGSTLSTTTIASSSVTVGTSTQKTEITSSGITATSGTISSNNITATNTLTGKSLVINGVTRISDIGSINAGWLTVGESSSDGVEITGDGNITASGRVLLNGLTSVQNTLNAKDINAGNVYTTDYINTKGSVRTNGVERITNTGVMYPTKLNFRDITNCAYISSGNTEFDVTISIAKNAGTTGNDYVRFGAKIPNLSYSSEIAQAQILLACVSIQTRGDAAHEFNSVHTALLTGFPDTNQGSTIFTVYSGNGTTIGESWGQIRVSYQPYSFYSTSNPVAPECYISYKKNPNFNDVETAIRVDLYPIAIFG